jgi:hypothetical protein
MCSLVVVAGGCASRAVADVSPTVTSPAGDEELGRVVAAVTEALAAAPARGQEPVPKHVRLLGVERRKDGSIALQFNADLLLDTNEKTLGDAVDRILAAANSVLSGTGDAKPQVIVLADGIAVDSYLLNRVQ